MKRYLFPLILIATGVAQAATVNFTITLGNVVPTSAGLTAGQSFPGSVSYDASLVPLTGTVILTPQSDPTLTVNLTFAGFGYGALDDTAHPLFPQFSFVDGAIHGISYWAVNKHPDSSVDGFVQIEGNPNRFSYSFDGESEYSGALTWPFQTIPEPQTAILLSAAMLLIYRRKRPDQT